MYIRKIRNILNIYACIFCLHVWHVLVNILSVNDNVALHTSCFWVLIYILCTHLNQFELFVHLKIRITVNKCLDFLFASVGCCEKYIGSKWWWSFKRKVFLSLDRTFPRDFFFAIQLFTLSVPFTTEAKIQQYELLSYQVVMLVVLVMSQKLIQKIFPILNQVKKVKVRWRAKRRKKL